MGLNWSSAPVNDDVPSLNQHEALKLSHETHYKPEELQKLYYRFSCDLIALSPGLSEESPQGIDFPLFCSCTAFLGVRSPLLQEMFFATFDQNRDGIITFSEFVKVLSVMSRGTPNEKVNLAFDMFYCVNAYPHPMPSGTHMLQRRGVRAVLQALEATFGGLLVCCGQGDQQEQGSAGLSTMKVLDDLFESSEEVTRKEFAAYALRCPAILKGLFID